MICCETYKFVNRTQVDSFVMNEIGKIHTDEEYQSLMCMLVVLFVGNPDDLVNTKTTYNSNHQSHPNPTSSALENWREQPNLRLLNLLYDVTPSKYITLVITEVGLIPCTSAPVVSALLNPFFLFLDVILTHFLSISCNRSGVNTSKYHTRSEGSTGY